MNPDNLKYYPYEEHKVEDYQPKENIKMNNGIGKLSWVNVKSALVYGLVAVVLAIIAKGSIFGLEWRVLADVGVMAVLTSFVKNIFTTNEGNFAGTVQVVEK